MICKLRGDFDIKDKSHSGRLSVSIRAIIATNPRISTEEIAKNLNINNCLLQIEKVELRIET